MNKNDLIYQSNKLPALKQFLTCLFQIVKKAFCRIEKEKLYKDKSVDHFITAYAKTKPTLKEVQKASL